MKKIRIGSGAGFAGDRLEPALTLLEKGNLQYIGFECLAERTIALAQKEKKQWPERGFNPMLQYRMEKVLPLAYLQGVKVITNMSAAHPEGALQLIREIAHRMELKGMKIATVLGDDILLQVHQYLDQPILESKQPLSSLSEKIISANAYLGISPLVEALQAGADVVITGRVADPSLFLAPMVYEFGWPAHDYNKLGKGTLVGHLLECAGQISGGYFADPGRKDVPDLWNLGFPYVEVGENGEGFLTKVEGSGGLINKATCTEQLLYEIHDPASYLTPDCIANFSGVQFQETGRDKVAFCGAGGAAPTDHYKVSVGYQHGYVGVGEISYGGYHSRDRALMAQDIISKRIEHLQLSIEDIRYNLIGINSVLPKSAYRDTTADEVRLRVAGRSQNRSHAHQIAEEVEALYTNGPAGGGGATKFVEELISVVSILVLKSKVQTQILYQQIQ